MTCPETPAACGEQRYRTVSATCSRSTYLVLAGIDASFVAVRIAAGASALARTPDCLPSSATERISASTDDFAATYPATPLVGAPSRAASDAKKTTDPPSVSSIGRKARVARYAVFTLIPKRRANAEGSLFA